MCQLINAIIKAFLFLDLLFSYGNGGRLSSCVYWSHNIYITSKCYLLLVLGLPGCMMEVADMRGMLKDCEMLEVRRENDHDHYTIQPHHQI
jgi:hypothetical protein